MGFGFEIGKVCIRGDFVLYSMIKTKQSWHKTGDIDIALCSRPECIPAIPWSFILSGYTTYWSYKLFL